MNLRTAEDVIKATRPEDIFSMDKTTIEEEKEGYVKLFTPSPYNNVKHFVASQKVVLLYEEALSYFDSGYVSNSPRKVPEDEIVKFCLSKEDDTFVLIRASELSLDDEFMKHIPRTGRERKFKDELEKVIKRGIKDFWKATCDPAFNADKTGICFEPGNMPAVGRCYNWWKEKAKAFDPARKSRLGTKGEYVAFLGCLIKNLVENGWEIDKAWDTVCNDSKELGHYINSKDSKDYFESTGSREVLGFYDLANTCKLLSEDEDTGGFWLAGGYYCHGSYFSPLAGLYHGNNGYSDYGNSVGWLVLEW